MKKSVVLFGNGGHAKVIADIIKQSGDTIIGFLSDPQYCCTNELDLPYLGAFKDCEKFAYNNSFVLAFGDNLAREKIANRYTLEWYTAIHPSAIVDPTVKILEGSVVMPRAVVNSCAKIGRHSIINTGSVVEHDCIIGDFTHISPLTAVCGAVHLGNRVHLGAGTTVINQINICDDVIVGAGSTVIRNITNPGTYVGNPVRLLQKDEGKNVSRMLSEII